jgi:hypothetical protein
MITPTTQSYATNAASATVTVNHAVNAGEALYVGVMAIAGSQGFGTNPLTAPTFNGVTMTLLTKYDTDVASGSQALGIYCLPNPTVGTHTISFTHSGDHNGGVNFNGAVIGLSVLSASGIGVSGTNHQPSSSAQVTLTTTKPNSLIFNIGISAVSTASSITGTNFVNQLFSGETNWWYEGGYDQMINPGNSARTILMQNSNQSTIAAVEITSIPWGGFFLKMIN